MEGSIVALVKLPFDFFVTIMEKFLPPELAEFVAAITLGVMLGTGVLLATAPVSLPAVAAVEGGGAIVGAVGSINWAVGKKVVNN